MIFDFLYPRKCIVCDSHGRYFCERCGVAMPVVRQICPICIRWSVSGTTHDRCIRPLGMDGLVSVFPYSGAIQDAVKQFKYRFVRELGDSFVELINLRVDRVLVDFFKKEGFIITPVPLHKLRKRWRGFNQAELLGELLAKKWDVDFQDIIARVKNTDSLAEVKARISKEEKEEIKKKYASMTQRKLAERKLVNLKKEKFRKNQMRGAFQLGSKKYEVKGKKFLIVDDVWTSGATMIECSKVLKRLGAGSVWGFTFAKSRG